MTFDGAIIKEQGITFGIVLVKPNVLNSSDKDNLRQKFGVLMHINANLIVLAVQKSSNFTYYGRPDIVKFLSNINPNRIPWKRFTVN